MFGYYFRLGLHSLKRNPVLTALMVLGIGLGIAASMTALTVFHLMSSSPISWKNNQLFAVQLDNWALNQSIPGKSPTEPPEQLTYRDAQALMEAGKGTHQAAMFKVSLPIQSENPEVKPFRAVGRATYAEFFPLFEIPFQYGGPWDHNQEVQHSRVVVLSKQTNETLFGGQNSVGKSVRMNAVDYTVVGVLGDWNPSPKFFELGTYAYRETDHVFLPLPVAVELQLRFVGVKYCFEALSHAFDSLLQSDCVWVQFWVQLDSLAQQAEYKTFLDNYTNEQKKLGRFPRSPNNKLINISEWMRIQKMVSRDVEVQVGLAFSFLLVCLINTVGLLLAKFVRKTAETSLRRALGATRGQLFVQHMVESGVVGVTGGLVGLLFTWIGLFAVRALYDNYQHVARLDWTMILTTAILAVVAALLAGLFPTWRACQVAPAAQLKTQ